MFDYRLKIIEEDLGKIIYPSWKECWLTKHKPRLLDWMNAHDIPHPRSWVFLDRQEALDFAMTVGLPVVVKTATGASASGIRIVRSAAMLQSVIRAAFGRGLCPRGYDPNDRQWFCLCPEIFT